MKQLILLLPLLLSVTAQIPYPLPPCLQYLSDLQALYNSSHAEFMQQMAPFAVWSGKMLDDMGFPISCLKNPSNAFWEVEVGVRSESGPLTTYYGLCFTAVCNAQTLNQNAGFLINALVHNTTQEEYQITSIQFTGVNMEPEITVGSVLVSVLLSLFTLSRMSSSFLRWGKLCASQSEEEAVAVESEELQEEKEAGRMPEHSLSFLERYSLERAFSTLFEKEESRKVYAFSLFKILTMPFMAFGYLFYLSNYGAANYFSFNQEIYGTFYAKLACFAYYLPDAFFFISAFVFARKLIRKDEAEDGSSALSIFGALGRRMLKLYPLYIVMILVYGFVTPSLHAGPLWGIYQQQVGECKTGWWRAMLLIDNWWTPGCFSFAWYVQVQAQLCLLAALIFLLYSYRRDAALITLYILLIASFVGLFFGAQLPTSIETATSHNAILYFQAFYSHLFFYLLGLYFAFVFEKLSVRAFVRERVLAVQPLITGLTVVAFALLLLIVNRPRVWDHSLRVQLAASRIGVMVSLILFFLPSLAHEDAYASRVHRLSRLTYGIILSIGLVTAAGFWGLNFFAYVDSTNLLESSISYLLISVAVGAPLAVIFDFTPFLFPDTV